MAFDKTNPLGGKHPVPVMTAHEFMQSVADMADGCRTDSQAAYALGYIISTAKELLSRGEPGRVWVRESDYDAAVTRATRYAAALRSMLGLDWTDDQQIHVEQIAREALKEGQ